MTVFLPGCHHLDDDYDAGVELVAEEVADRLVARLSAVHPALRCHARAAMLRRCFGLPATSRCVAGPKHDALLSELSADRWSAQRALARPWRAGGLRALFPWPPTDLLRLASLPPAVAEALARAGLTPRPQLGEMRRATIRATCAGVLGDQRLGVRVGRALVDVVGETVGPAEGPGRDLTARPLDERTAAQWAWRVAARDLPVELQDPELVWAQVILGPEVWGALGAAAALLAA